MGFNAALELFHVSHCLDPELIEEKRSCGSRDELLPPYDKYPLLDLEFSLRKCGEKCIRTPGCKYFSFGNALGKHTGECYWEKTSGKSCPEGWIVDKGFDFYGG